ncbi:unnamed protein product [Vicia faba]|uniref:FLZ-type domain-containing protein n=1 Tax=Vicia faba TaxID=3906 RepID=A0AAV1AS21_VICFA|nr:unnamed protein product [Vicia faba]
MADSSPSFSLPSETISPRQICSSIFHTSGSKVGVGVKNLPEFESVWSPTSPLDCRLFSNLSNVFGVKSSRKAEHKKPLDGSKVGLGIITSLVNETKSSNEILGEFQRKNIIFGSQVKNGILQFSNKNLSLASCLKTNSLPKNYVISLPSETKSPLSKVENIDSGVNEVTSTTSSFAPVMNRSSPVDDSLKIKSCPLPIYVGSLSAKEIELSEDYTCIISHGPNPKRTHIFGDCILECDNNDFTEFSKKEEPAFKSSQESAPRRFDSVTRFCYSCCKKLDEEEDIYAYSEEKAFCSFKCRSEEIFAEDEMEKTCTNSEEHSPNSSYHDDIFLMALQVSK